MYWVNQIIEDNNTFNGVPVKKPEIQPPQTVPDNPAVAPPEIKPLNDPAEPNFSPPVKPPSPKPEIEEPDLSTINFF